MTRQHFIWLGLSLTLLSCLALSSPWVRWRIVPVLERNRTFARKHQLDNANLVGARLAQASLSGASPSEEDGPATDGYSLGGTAIVFLPTHAYATDRLNALRAFHHEVAHPWLWSGAVDDRLGRWLALTNLLPRAPATSLASEPEAPLTLEERGDCRHQLATAGLVSRYSRSSWQEASCEHAGLFLARPGLARQMANHYPSLRMADEAWRHAMNPLLAGAPDAGTSELMAAGGSRTLRLAIQESIDVKRTDCRVAIRLTLVSEDLFGAWAMTCAEGLAEIGGE